ncbi:MAG: Tetraacyldisaccharide 4'-kinase [Planctomycetes bacterium]|nr:Tetraacyldisaccharide 4'-kinase [Planctomycetota bacterium]
MTSCCASYRRVISGEAHGIGPALARGALSVLSVPYGAAARFRDAWKSGDEVAVDMPVISVGNLTAGGTGKTPVVSMIVDDLVRRGRRPVVLSRGYKACEGQASDEAQVLARRHPGVLHVHSADRLAGADRIVAAQLGDVIVLDDGFQVRNLHRDLNVCCIDATNPWGYGSVLPRGLLREPPSALYRARPVLVTRTELVAPAVVDEIRSEVLRHSPYATVLVSRMAFTKLTDAAGAPAGSPSDLAGRRVRLASGIGNPKAFVAGVRGLGAAVTGHTEMEDHHAWCQAEADALAKTAAAESADMVVVTAKDAVKLAALAWPASAPPLRSLDITAEVADAAAWKKLIDGALARD